MSNKGRKIHTLIGTCLAAALPCLAVASPPSDVAVGQIDAILNFCTKAVPRLGESAETYRKLLTHDASARVRSSTAYQQGYEQVSDALAKGNQAQEIAACATGLSDPKSRDDARHGHRGRR
jgi:hypothetical protein